MATGSETTQSGRVATFTPIHPPDLATHDTPPICARLTIALWAALAHAQRRISDVRGMAVQQRCKLFSKAEILMVAKFENVSETA